MTNKQTCKQLSILIPVYNYVCTPLVSSLQKQAGALGIEYEIIVADDGSPDKDKVEANRSIETIPHCTYIVRNVNAGRAAIRNFLSGRAAYGRLLFLDCDVSLPDGRFLERYLNSCDRDVTYGGVCTDGDAGLLRGNIRFIYERASEPRHTAAERARRPYMSFRTTNFMISREAMLAHPFDERFRFYGYEDVLFGKQLQENGVGICHIDNPVAIKDFESNDIFIAKTEEGLRTLYRFRNELGGYSRMLTFIERTERFFPMAFVRLWHRIFGKLERRNLTGRRPILKLFDIYRLGYYLSLTN